MLLFIDEPRNIKVVRQEPDGGPREVLGKIKKIQPEIGAELKDKLKTGEEAQIEAVFRILEEGEEARVRNTIAAFPATIRDVLTYYRETATEAEQRWILGALLEGLRVVRKHEREAAQPVAA